MHPVKEVLPLKSVISATDKLTSGEILSNLQDFTHGETEVR